MFTTPMREGIQGGGGEIRCEVIKANFIKFLGSVETKSKGFSSLP